MTTTTTTTSTAPTSGRARAATAQHLVAVDGYLRSLLAIAVLLLAFALGTKVNDMLHEGSGGPVRLTYYEAQQLQQVRYALWLDHLRRGGAAAQR